MERRSDAIDANEIEWFANYYLEHRYNKLGFQMRFQRDLEVLLRFSGQKRFRKVLSVGCGEGTFELLLARYCEQIIGLDLSPQAVEAAQRNARHQGIDNVSFECAHHRDLDFVAGSFDLVTCLAFLHHLPEADLPEFLADMHTLLEPGGAMYSQDPNVNGILRKIGRVVMGDHYHAYHSPDERELDPPSIQQLYLRCGFQTAKMGYWDFCLIPMSFVLAGRPSWPLYLCRVLDWVLCRSPISGWGSGFTVLARR